MYPVLFPVKHSEFPVKTPSAIAIAERFWTHVRKSEGCWEWVGEMHSKGYGRLSFDLKRRDGKEVRLKVRAHRISWLLNCGEIPEGMGVLHTCDNRMMM